jgi:hypothetical protein
VFYAASHSPHYTGCIWGPMSFVISRRVRHKRKRLPGLRLFPLRGRFKIRRGLKSMA